MPSTCPIKKHPDTGLLYTLEGNEATIVGCAQADLTHLDIPPVIVEDGVQYPVTAVGESAFAYQAALQTLRIPARLSRIGHGAFEGSGLTEVHLHDGLKVVAPYAFFGCVHLSHVGLPLGVTLEEQSFAGCEALRQENVSNIACLGEEALRRAGLPMASAGPTVIYVDGQPVEKHEKAPAELLLEKGVAMEESGDHHGAAAAYMQAHRMRQVISQVDDMLRQAEQMRPIAMAEYRLALMLKFGLASAKNPDGTDRPTAVALLSHLVDTSDLADAAYHLGDMYAGGYGIPADPDMALRLLRNAAERGHERACLDLGYIYLRTAVRYFAKCAEMDGPYADIARTEMAGFPVL